MTYPAIAVANDDDGGKTEPAAALYDLGNTIDTDQPLEQIAFFTRVTPSASRWCLCHIQNSLKVQTALAGRLGKSFDTPVKNITPAIENHVADTGRLRTFSNKLTNLRGGIDV